MSYSHAFDNGNKFAESGDLNTAIACYTEAIEIKPDCVAAYLRRGDAYGELSEWGNKIADYNMVIELKPNHAEAYIQRANFYCAKRTSSNFRRAIADYTHGIQLKPKDEDGYLGRAEVYSIQGDHEKAVADWTKVIQLNPKNSRAYNRRADTYFVNSEYEKAKSDYYKVIRLDPFHRGVHRGAPIPPEVPRAYHHLGVAYEMTGNHEKAVEYKTTARKLDYRGEGELEPKERPERTELAKIIVRVGFIVAGADGISDEEREELSEYAARRSNLSAKDIEGEAKAAEAGLSALSALDVAILRKLPVTELSSLLHEVVEEAASADGEFSDAEQEALKSIWQMVTG